ncbi:MAG: hypothetical protein AB7F43_05930 [Bacteriovoracia bacterium]
MSLRTKRKFWIFLWLFLLILPQKLFADFHDLPDNLAKAVLSETVPAAFNPSDFKATDFSFEWLGPAISGVEASVGTKSIEWVRVADVFAIPRGRLILSAQDVEVGQVSNNGFSQSLVIDGNVAKAELPIALISGEQNPIRISIKRKGKVFTGTLLLRFKAQKRNNGEYPQRVFHDLSCSPWKVSVEPKSLRHDTWVYVGCRMVYSEGAEHSEASLEVFVFWDNIPKTIQIDGVSTTSTSVAVWPLRLRSQPGKVTLSTSGQDLFLRYSIPPRMSKAFIGLGAGPYVYTYDGAGHSIKEKFVPEMTVYGSYFFEEKVRLVFFSIIPIASTIFADSGLYVVTEQFRSLDRHFSLSILLGAHVLAFPGLGKNNVQFSAPQGFEIVYRGLFGRRDNLSLGAFVYPPIGGRSYYNAWLRWGTSIFGELNYIAWREPLSESESVYTRSVGVSFGMPLFRFL